MKNILFICLMILSTIQLQAQDKTENPNQKFIKEDTAHKEEIVCAFVDVMPVFIGGEDALISYLQKNIRYPAEAFTKNIQGTVFVEFIVEKDGSISHPRILKGIGGGCNEESLRVVKSMPRWKPAIQKGKNVRFYYTVPIVFRLE